jgi:hypothetical protein
MAWHSPKTWAALYEVTAADFNLEIRDLFNVLFVGTAAGDIDYYDSATTKAKLTKGTARQGLAMKSDATVPEWQDTPQKVLTNGGDMLYASAANTMARVAKGTSRQSLTMNSGATAPEWTPSPASLMTAQGDILIASAANTPAKLAKGTSRQGLAMNAGATAPEWQDTPQKLMTAAGDMLVASGANTPARFPKGGEGSILRIVDGAPLWQYFGTYVFDEAVTNEYYDGDAVDIGTFSVNTHDFNASLPPLPRAIYITLAAKWATADASAYCLVRSQLASTGGVIVRPIVANMFIDNTGIVPCFNGDFDIIVAGQNALSVYVNVWGYLY